MGRKIRNIVLIMMLFPFGIFAQENYDFQSIDSLTYKYYLNGNWDSLLNLANQAVRQNIDYKFLRQRMGFAYFSGSRFGDAQKQFSKALEFDGFDTFSLEYLYLSYLYDGNDDGANVIAGKMTGDTRKSMAVKLFRPIESLEAEYNFKYAGTQVRSNPQYYHIGLTSRLGARLSLFQMFSNYTQTITVRYPMGETYIKDAQPEYYVLLKYSVSPNISLNGAYHFLNTTYSLTTSYANLGYLGLSADYPGIRFGGSFSVLDIYSKRVTQAGLYAGVKRKVNSRAYLTGELYHIKNSDSAERLIYTQRAGLRINPGAWLEGSVTFGNLSDFSEFSAMYIYNSVDPTTFRCGSTLFLFPGRRLGLWFNFFYERKDFYENLNYHYNQFSYLGGIKWKI